MPRELNDNFMNDLNQGMLKPLLDKVKADRDLSLEIRENYINIYACGNSIPKLIPSGKGYKCVLHPRFVVDQIGRPTGDMLQENETDKDAGPIRYVVFDWLNEMDVNRYVEHIPFVKQQVAEHRPTANEIEVEQLLVRTCSTEAYQGGACNVDYIAIDRQIADVRTGGRIDVLGLFWKPRQQHQQVPLCIIEVKHMLNPDIDKVHEQLWRYRELWHECPNRIADEVETIAHQKVALGLLRPEIATLQINRDPYTAKYIIVFVDHNPRSERTDRLQKNAAIFAVGSDDKKAFVEQIEIFRVGYGLWGADAQKILE